MRERRSRISLRSIRATCRNRVGRNKRNRIAPGFRRLAGRVVANGCGTSATARGDYAKMAQCAALIAPYELRLFTFVAPTPRETSQ